MDPTTQNEQNPSPLATAMVVPSHSPQMVLCGEWAPDGVEWGDPLATANGSVRWVAPDQLHSQRLFPACGHDFSLKLI
jgi:hypothetical protein